MLLFPWVLASVALLFGSAVAISDELAAELGYPPGVDVWCGKAYRPTNASFEPGGVVTAPALSPGPLLYLSIRPRYNLYLASENIASFIIEAPISYMHGNAFMNSSFDKGANVTKPFLKLFIDVSVIESGLELISGQNITINSTSDELGFTLAGLTPRTKPYKIVITGAPSDGAQFYTATTELSYLPDRTDGGSVTKIDNLYGGLLVQDYLQASRPWTQLFPYTFYTSWDGWLELSIDRVKDFKDKGYNIIHIVPNAGLPNQAFNWTELDGFLDEMDKQQLWLMFDMRWTYMNLSSVTTQVERLKSRKSLLLWYTGDEPDGSVDPLNATSLSYSHIKSLDPYHPVSLCLNCINYYFSEYTSGTDIILSDPYPIAMNASFSTPYQTVCNSTYGDCGCDGCSGSFNDVSNRLDLFTQYQTWLGQPLKPQWGVPQAFGNETFWARYPSPEEEVVMNMLFVSHGAKGICMWSYPTEPGLEAVTSELSKVLTNPTITGLLLSAMPQKLSVEGAERVGVTAWKVGNKVLVSVVNMDYVGNGGGIVVMSLPWNPKRVEGIYWGVQPGWTVRTDGKLWKDGMGALEVAVFVVELA